MAMRGKKGQEYITIAEAVGRWWKSEKKAAQVPAVLKGFNPLQLRCGDSVKIETAKLLKFAGFVVSMVDVYERHVGGEVFSFADYVLVDDTTEAEQKWTTCRVNPIGTGVPDASIRMSYLVLTPHIMCEWKDAVQTWTEVLPRGEVRVELPEDGGSVVFYRVEGLTDPYVARVTEFKGDDPEEVVDEITYYDFVREVSPGRQQYYFFERNERTGTVQSFVGEPVYDDDIKLRRREVK